MEDVGKGCCSLILILFILYLISAIFFPVWVPVYVPVVRPRPVPVPVPTPTPQPPPQARPLLPPRGGVRSPNGIWIAVPEQGGSIALMNSMGVIVWRSGSNVIRGTKFVSVAFSPDDNVLLASDDAGMAVLWYLPDHTKLGFMPWTVAPSGVRRVYFVSNSMFALVKDDEIDFYTYRIYADPKSYGSQLSTKLYRRQK